MVCIFLVKGICLQNRSTVELSKLCCMPCLVLLWFYFCCAFLPNQMKKSSYARRSFPMNDGLMTLSLPCQSSGWFAPSLLHVIRKVTAFSAVDVPRVCQSLKLSFLNFFSFLTIMFFGKCHYKDKIKRKVDCRQVFLDFRYCTNNIGIIVCVTKFL